MDRNVTAFRERFNAYKNGKPVSEIYDAGLPKYANGTEGNIPAYQRFVEEMGPVLYREVIKLGVKNPDVAFKNMITQLGYESNYGLSKVARQLNNFGGVGWNGKTYTTYKDRQDFVENYVRLMNSRYKNVIGADTLAGYAKGLKSLNYYGDTVENYTRNLVGMKSFAKALNAHILNNPDLYNQLISVQEPSPYIAKPVSTAIRNVIPEEKTIPAYDPTISPYISGKPMLKLRPRVQFPNLIELMEDSEWEPKFPGFKNGKLPGYKWGTQEWDKDDSTEKAEQWADDWLFRLTPAAGSKVILLWNTTGNKPEPESAELYTLRRIKQTEWKKPSGRKMLEMAPAAVDFIPGASDIKQALDATAAGVKGNYIDAGLLGAGLFLPTFLKKPIRSAKKYFKSFMEYKTSPLDIRVRAAENQTWGEIIASKIADKKARLNPIKPSESERSAFRKAWDYVPEQKVYDSVQEVSDITGYTGRQLSDFVNVINEHPEFYLYVKLNKIKDPFNQKTISDFLNQQYTSKRGVVATNKDEAVDMLTSTDPGRPMSGGDRLNTYGGLYTTNHNKISDRFKNPEGFKTGDGYVGTVRYKHSIPTNIPLLEQLERYRRSILLADQRNPLFGTTYYRGLLSDARINPNIVAIQSDYVGRSGNGVSAQEMAYLPKGSIKQHPVELQNIEYYPNLTDKHGRWGYGVSLDDEGKKGLFIPIINNRRSDYVNAAREFLRGKYNGVLYHNTVNELENLFASQNKKYYDLLNQRYNKLRKLKNVARVTAGISAAVGIPSALVYGATYPYKQDFYKSPEYEEFLKDPNFDKYANLDDGDFFKLSSLQRLEKKYELKYRKRTK